MKLTWKSFRLSGLHPGIIQCQSWTAELNHNKMVRIKGIFEHKNKNRLFYTPELKDDFLLNEIEIL